MASTPLPGETLFLPDEAAARLSMSVKTLMRHVKAGRLRFINIGTQTRKVYRFTAKNLQTFIENQKVREVPACPSTKSKIPHTTTMTSKSVVVAFTALPKPPTKKTPKP